MNATPYLHLLWKEFRAIRLFWISIVVLAVLLGLLMTALLRSEQATANVIFNLALGAPALFAIGCAGAAFAMEKEEGTIDFLKANPVSARQVLVSKITLAAIATLMMFFLLMPLAEFWTGARLQREEQWATFGLWLPAILEAIAWGTFFSLLTARPLLAVILAIAAATTSTHLLASQAREHYNSPFELAAYLRAAPWRVLVSLLVLGADVYLGLRWLDERVSIRRKKKGTTPSGATLAVDHTVQDNTTSVRAMARKPDRSAMLGHLLWQHWRQSKWLMLLIPIIGLPIAIYITGLLRLLTPSVTRFVVDDALMPLCLTIWASLIGSMVFLADQERRHFRFFAEHNVSPRYVWFSREFLWIVTVSISLCLILLYWVFSDGNVQMLWHYLHDVVQWQSNGLRDFRPPYFYLPPIGLGLTSIVVSFAAGQWMSMHVRSGIMAGFLGLLLSSGLFGWVLLMITMQVPFWWSVAPIVFVLLCATWLRAPDWILENTSWLARAKAAVAVVVPAVALMIAVPVYRVHEVPLVSPGFEPQEFLAQVTPEALATGELYRKANDLCAAIAVDSSEEERQAWLDRRVSPAFAQRLQENAESLKLVLEASRRPTCLLANPNTESSIQRLQKAYDLLFLVLRSGWQMEGQGKLDEALERYLAALRVVGQLADQLGSDESYVQSVFQEITAWAARKDQTAERIRTAIEKLLALDPSILRLDDRLKTEYILVRRAILDQPSLRAELLYHNLKDAPISADTFWGRLMPWEDHRAIRVLNMLTATALERLQGMQQIILAQENGMIDVNTAPSGLVYFLPQIDLRHARIGLRSSFASNGGIAVDKSYAWTNYWRADQHVIPRDYFAILNPGGDFGGYVIPPWIQSLDNAARWFETTRPNLTQQGLDGIQAAWDFAKFEADRRATIITLALEAYRLENGQLPKRLTEVEGPYLKQLPLDPYSSEQFRYFPDGLPELGQKLGYGESEFVRLYGSPWFPNVPGIWCSGPTLQIIRTPLYPSFSEDGEPEPQYVLRDGRYDQPLNKYEALARGFWFPIPEPQP